jgi:hypothetical protein
MATSCFSVALGHECRLKIHAGQSKLTRFRESVLREIQPDSKIVIERVVRPWYKLTVTLTARGDQTHLGWVQEFESPEVAATMRPLSESANEQNLDRLEALLASERDNLKNTNNMNSKNKDLSPEHREEVLSELKARFEENMNRHKGLEWAKVQAKLEAKANTKKLWSLSEMERTGGEPDVVGFDKKSGEYIFYDCSAESPKGRRSLCYDREALESRKEHKPKNNAIDMAAAMGIELLTEEQYRELQKLGNFDTKTSSWITTPSEIRKLGGAIFADYRFGRVFVYHNGAESYYAARAFRGSLRV